MTMSRLATTTAISLLTSAGIAAATPMVGLVDGTTLVMFDTETPAEITSMAISGTDRLVGIDWRPGNQTLVGVTADNMIVTVDPATGETSPLSEMNTPLPMADMPVIVDFNPMADRLRLMTGTTNHRVNVDTGEVTVDGELAFEEGDSNTGTQPMIAAAAYTNSFGQPDETAMYDIDTGLSALVRQTSPNDGTLAVISELGTSLDGMAVAFDIHTSENGTNTAWLVAGATVYNVDLETGAATRVVELDAIDGGLTDITAMPAS